jgi:hypothetical protein
VTFFLNSALGHAIRKFQVIMTKFHRLVYVEDGAFIKKVIYFRPTVMEPPEVLG